MANIVSPPQSYTYTSPQITVDIYPQSGGVYQFRGSSAGILHAAIHKNIRDPNGGKFIIEVAPGGPNGINDPNPWSTIIIPNSLVVISLSRGGSNRIVMIGVVAEVGEAQLWDNRTVRRITRISGFDFSYYFTAFSFYQMTFLGLLATSLPAGTAQYLLGLWDKMLQGPPNEVAFDFLQFIMLGTGDPNKPGVLQNTYVFYQGAQVFIRDMFAWWFENFPAFVPLQTDAMNSEGRWLDKFLGFLPFPWYEFFIQTAHSGDYPALTVKVGSTLPSTLPATSITTGSDITHIPNQVILVQGDTSLSFLPSYPVVVGRINPLPWIEYPTTPFSSVTGTGVPNSLPATSVAPTSAPTGTGIATLHNDAWEGLTIYSLGTTGYIRSDLRYDTSEVANFFSIQSLDTAALAQNNPGADPTLFAFDIFGGVVDPYSINTYGFKPIFGDVRWFTIFGSIGGTEPIDSKQLATIMLGMLASYYIPTPNMLSGSVEFPMWPDILPGNRFVYNPYKGNTNPYMFYIEGVTHKYTFGEACTTTVEVSRGLPQSAYDNPNTLSAILMDTAVHKDGNFTLRADLNTNTPAYAINPSIVASKTGAGRMPWTGAPPVITSSAPLPSSVTTQYDGNFANAAINTSCGPSAITPQLLKSIAYQESKVNNSAVNPSTGAIGIMQVLPNSTYGNPPQPVNNALLASDPNYNITVGAQILCDKLRASGGNTLQALALYGGYTGLSDPKDPLNNYIYPILAHANYMPNF